MAKTAPKNPRGADKYRREELAKIHIAKKDLNLSDDIYRDILYQAGGVESSADLDYRGRAAVLDRFAELGWEAKSKGGTSPRSHAHSSRRLADDPQSKKIRALWLELHSAGKVRDSSEKALASYVERMTCVAALQWLDSKQAQTVIESLKKWLDR